MVRLKVAFKCKSQYHDNKSLIVVTYKLCSSLVCEQDFDGKVRYNDLFYILITNAVSNNSVIPIRFSLKTNISKKNIN